MQPHTACWRFALWQVGTFFWMGSSFKSCVSFHSCQPIELLAILVQLGLRIHHQVPQVRPYTNSPTFQWPGLKEHTGTPLWETLHKPFPSCNVNTATKSYLHKSKQYFVAYIWDQAFTPHAFVFIIADCSCLVVIFSSETESTSGRMSEYTCSMMLFLQVIVINYQYLSMQTNHYLSLVCFWNILSNVRRWLGHGTLLVTLCHGLLYYTSWFSNSTGK